MGMISVGFNPDAQGSFTPFPEGSGYHFKIVEQKIKPASAEGKFPQLEVLCECLASESGEKIGAKTRMWLSFSPNSVPFFLKPFIEATGIWFEHQEVAGPDGKPVPALSFDPDQLEGMCFQAKCKHEKKQGGDGVREAWSDFAASEFNPQPEAAPEPEPEPAPAPTPAPAAAAPRPAAAAPASAPRPGAVPPRAAPRGPQGR